MISTDLIAVTRLLIAVIGLFSYLHGVLLHFCTSSAFFHTSIERPRFICFNWISLSVTIYLISTYYNV